MKSLLTVFSLTAVCAVQAGIVVDAQSNVPRRVCTLFRIYRTAYRYPQKVDSPSELQLCGARLSLTLP